MPGRGHRVDVDTLLVVGLLVPAGVVVLTQVGPLWLIAARKFADLIDGLTFGIAAGTAFAAVETLVLHGGVIFDGPSRIESPNAALWVAIIVVGGLIKPIVYGSATGIACASFSGIGSGYDGFKAQYGRGLLEAFVANVVFQVGLYLTGQLGGTLGVILGLVWGLIVAAMLVLRVRVLLHAALLESALQSVAAGSVPDGANSAAVVCAECEYPLLADAAFCVACGMSVRTISKLSRTGAPSVVSGSSARGTRYSSGVMIFVAVAVVALVGGLAAAINTGTRPDAGDRDVIEVGTDGGSGGGRSGVHLQIPAQIPGGAGEEDADTVEGPLGIEIALPAGWEFANESEFGEESGGGGATVIWNPDRGSTARVVAFKSNSETSAADWMTSYMIDTVLAQELQEIEGTLSTRDDTPETVADNSVFNYEAIFVHNQGSTPLEGYAEVLVTQDNYYVSFDASNPVGEWDQSQADYDAIYSSMLATMPGQPLPLAKSPAGRSGARPGWLGYPARGGMGGFNGGAAAGAPGVRHRDRRRDGLWVGQEARLGRPDLG